MQTKRVLLTGASGFVGSHVLRHLLVNTNWDIVCLVSFRHQGITDRIRLSVTEVDDSFARTKILRHDLTAPITPVLANEIGHIDYVFNIASESHVDRSITDPIPFIQNNVALITHMLDYARTYNIEKFLQISTDEVYGPAPEGHFHKEWVDQFFPSNPYSASKAAQESICYSFWRTYNMPIVITNTMNIIGEMQGSEKFVPMLIKNIVNDITTTIHGSIDGQIGSRFYLHARNQADALLHVINQPVPRYGEADRVEKFHVVGDREVNNMELAQMVAEYVGKPLKYEIVDFQNSRPGHDLRYALDGNKLRSTGWVPPLNFEESLERTIKWTLSHPEWLNI